MNTNTTSPIYPRGTFAIITDNRIIKLHSHLSTSNKGAHYYSFTYLTDYPYSLKPFRINSSSIIEYITATFEEDVRLQYPEYFI